MSVWVFLFWKCSIDDAFITFRYAENLADGHGFVFNRGGQAVEGYSNFLWLLILALLYKIGLPTYLCAKIIGIITVLITGILWYRFPGNGDYGKMTWLTGPFFLICPVTAFWAVSGLELGLHCLLIVLSLVTVVKHSRWLYLLGPLVVLNRPEGIAVALAILFVFALVDIKQGRFNRKFYFISAVTVVLTLAGLIVFRQLVFGYPFPNTYYAKMHHPLIWGYKMLGKMMLIFLPFTIATAWFIIKSIAVRAGNLRLLAFTAVLVVQAAISGRVNPIMNFFFRYMMPFFPLLIAVSLAVVSAFRRPVLRTVAGALCMISLLAPTFMIFSRIEQEETIKKAQWKVIEWAENLPPATTISMIDMGRIPYYASGNTYFDLWGLINKDTGHEGFDPAREFYRFPDYFIFVGYIEDNRSKLHFSREQMITNNPDFPQAYEFTQVFYPDDTTPYEPGYYYLLFERRPDAVEKFRRP